MKPTTYPSKFVLTVAKAIKNLKEENGSTPKHIFGQVVSDYIVQNRLPHPRTIASSIQKTLRHGLKKGVFVKENGRFKLVQEKLSDIRQVAKRRRGRSPSRRRPRRNRRRTRRMMLKNDDVSNNESDVEDQNGEPMDRTRRRRRRRQSRRRRPTKRVANSQESNDNSGEENKVDGDFRDDKLDLMNDRPQPRRSTSRHSCKEPQIK